MFNFSKSITLKTGNIYIATYQDSHVEERLAYTVHESYYFYSILVY